MSAHGITLTIWRKTVAGENFGKFGKSGAIHQSFTRSNLHKNCGLPRKNSTGENVPCICLS